ncbi:NAD-dependent epimerase/dehydratase family protein [Allokutzneria albata]|uniref:Nucleoside-diphosphate-sugar epimerase n=1 Tax=Allokutzneria albata TaxID=211114 RepID=A0A1G9V4P7_ALLAB|nr:NAD-dependent epimerase/dehydratase family protein [Allokutzneria albata]SDM67090.1 Nucleoside-diphosphate-sugar epimerase [Allokutzneria albata]
MKTVCVIGGSRHFGRDLVLNLRDAGVGVTLVNRGSTAPPPGVDHLVTDRADLDAALGTRTFDVVVDQVCYTRADAETAVEAFAGRTARYVMTSTIEVYEHVRAEAPLPETAVDLHATAPQGYGQGKREAEAVFATTAPFDFVAVRSGHVLGGNDFTGRLAHYVDRVRDGRPIVVRPRNHPSSFIHHREIAELLGWAALADFTGPVNARSHGELSVFALCEQIPGDPVFEVGEDASPFAFGHYYGMDNSRAAELGFTFSRTEDWLPEVVGA